MKAERLTSRVGCVVISMRFGEKSGAVSLGSDGWPTDRQEFAAAVREARKAASMSQVELAEKVDISEVTIRSIETGRTKPAAPHRQWVITALTQAGQGSPKVKP